MRGISEMIRPTNVGKKRISGSVSERHHLQRVLAESGKVPCDCVEWDHFELPSDRDWMGFRNWSVLIDCKQCELEPKKSGEQELMQK